MKENPVSLYPVDRILLPSCNVMRCRIYFTSTVRLVADEVYSFLVSREIGSYPFWPSWRLSFYFDLLLSHRFSIPPTFRSFGRKNGIYYTTRFPFQAIEIDWRSCTHTHTHTHTHSGDKLASANRFEKFGSLKKDFISTVSCRELG